MKKHEYTTTLRWTGNRGTGTSDYRAYGRDHEISAPLKAHPMALSSDPHFRGDASRYNPEDLLLAALAGCHLLSYLHLCAVNDIIVTAYEDHASGTMIEDELSARFTEVMLRPHVTITPESNSVRAMELHEEAGRVCFIARSVNFPVRHQPVISNG